MKHNCSNDKRRLLWIIVGLLFAGVFYSQTTLYFKCTSVSGGAYRWSTLANWYTNTGCTVPASGIPTSNTDVIFNNNAFTANNQIADFDQTSMSCKGFSVSYNGGFSTCQFRSLTSTKLNVFGDFDLTGLNNTKLLLTNWNGDVELNPANIGTLNTLTDKKTLYINRLIVPGNPVPCTVNFNDSIAIYKSGAVSNSAKIVIAQGYTNTSAVTVNFNQLVKNTYASGSDVGGIYIYAGNVTFNNGLFCQHTSGSINNSTYNDNSSLYAYNSSSITLLPNIQRGFSTLSGIVAKGTSSSNAPSIQMINQTIRTELRIDLDYANVNFANSVLNACAYKALYNYPPGNFYATNNTTLTTTNSTINIGDAGSIGVLGSMYLANHNYHIINVYQPVSVGDGSPQLFQFNVLNPVIFFSNGTNPTYTIKSGGLFSMVPGSSSSPYLAGVITFSVNPTASVSLVGNCSKPILLNYVNINFGSMPAVNMSADYLVLSNSIAFGSNTPYNAGANSIKVYGTTTTGWNVTCLPPRRTVYWQGALGGGNWSNANNWSLIPTASPSSPTTPITLGACLPTNQDSVVFPDLSNVSMDLSSVYCKSVRFVSTATINPIPSYFPVIRWNVSGGWWATNRLKNDFNGQLFFNTFEKFHLIKTGGVPFGSTNTGASVFFAGQFPPDASCLLDATKPKGGWLLLDTFALLKFDGTNYNVLWFNSGILKTYSPNPAFAAYYPVSQKKGSTMAGNISFYGSASDSVYLYDSDVYLYEECELRTPNSVFKEGTAEFILAAVTSGKNNVIMYSNNHINELTVKNYTYVPNSSYNQMAIQSISQTMPLSTFDSKLFFGGLDTVDVINNYQGLVIRADNASANVSRKITSINSQATSKLTFSSGSTSMTNYFIDSLYTKSNTNLINTSTSFTTNITIKRLMHIDGDGVILKMGNSNVNQFDNKATITFSNNATFISNGSCMNRNFISSYTPLGTATIFSKIILLGSINQTLTATDVQDNIVAGGVLNTDGFTFGTTTNWNAIGQAPRLLHWTDGLTSGGTTLDWSNTNRWRKSTSGSTSPSGPAIVWGTIPECPPTCQDTVIVDNSSFSSALDSVLINTTNYQAQVGKFYWLTTIGSPGFGGVTTANLSICDSLYFSNNMANRYRGNITLRGNPTTANTLGLKFGNQILRRQLVIDCYNPNTTYNLRDSLYINRVIDVTTRIVLLSELRANSSLIHDKGIFNTNGNTINSNNYVSAGNFNRKLVANNSKIRLRGNHGDSPYGGLAPCAWIVANHGPTKTYSLSTQNTRFIFNTNTPFYGTGLVGGGYNYNDVEFYGTSSGNIATPYTSNYYSGYNPNNSSLVDTFRTIYNNISVVDMASRLFIGRTVPAFWTPFAPVPKLIVKNVYNNTAPMDIDGTHVFVDSMECYYRNNTYGVYNIKTGNDYYKHWGLYGVTASQQINLAPDSVQWLHNLCDFRPVGNNTNKINFFSSTNGQKTYIRKDSSRVCSAWLVLKDIWAIGSGSSLGTITSPLCTTPAKPWLCDWDTLSTFDGLIYHGPITATSNNDANFTLSTRAWFQGGIGTDFQTNNQGWEKRDAEANPAMVLSNNPTICEGDTTLITMTLQGVLPFNVNWFENTNSPTFPAGNNVPVFLNIANPTSYTQTPSTATYVNSISPAGYIYYLVPTNGNALDAGTATNPFVLSIKVTPTITTQYTPKELSTGKCTNNVTTTLTATGSSNVNVLPLPKSLTASVSPAVLCNGSSPVTYTASAIGSNAYYLYSSPTGTTAIGSLASYTTGAVINGSLSVSSYTTNNNSPSIYTSYLGMVSANGCPATSRVPITVTVNPLPTISSFTTSGNCNITASASVTATNGTPLYTYSWTSNPSNSNTAANLTTGNYTVTVSDINNCVVTQSFSVSQPTAILTASVVSINSVLCFGNSTGSATTNITGGVPNYTVTWENNSSNTNTANGYSAGTYTYYVTDANGCTTSTQTFVISQPSSSLSINASSSNSVNCFGASTGSAQITVTGGSPGYTYSWSPSVLSATNIAASLTAGDYTATASDVNGCIITQTFNITEPNALVTNITNTTQAGCTLSNGSATYTVTGGTPIYTYSWSTGIGTYTTTATTINNLPAGVNQLIAIDANGCSTSTLVNITNPNAPTIIPTQTNVLCYGNSTGVAEAIVTGGTANYTYSWLPPTVISTTNTATGITSGTYVLTVTDDASCVVAQAYSITQPTAALTVSSVATNSILCYGDATGSATIITTGGTPNYSYTSNTGTSNNSNINNLSTGTYTYYVTDANSCATATQSFVINQPLNSLSVTASYTNALCNSQNNGIAEVSVIGGTPSYTYLWSSGTSNTQILNNISAGNYTVDITDVNNCVITQTFNITEPNTLITTITNTTQAGCGLTNGSATYTAVGGTAVYTYSWVTASSSYTTTSTTTNSLSVGNNQLTVIDVNGCTTNTFVNITNLNAPTVLTEATSINCFGNATGVITTTVSGGSAYTYTWSNGSHTGALVNVPAGIYTVVVQDANSCITTQTTAITQPTSAISLLISNVTLVNCFGSNSGSASVLVTGGTPGYTYTWSPLTSNNQAITNVPAGNYTISVTDIKGCITSSVAIINSVNSSALNVSVSNSEPATCEQQNGSIAAIVSGGTPNYTYLWNTGTSNNETLNNISAGNYTLIVSDNYGCKDTLTVTLDCKIELLVPEIFSPNGDGKNDKFDIKGITNYPNNNIQIFNRWGSLVYTKNKYNNDWDGKANVGDALGKSILPAGTYYVMLDFGDGQTKPYHGYVQVVN